MKREKVGGVDMLRGQGVTASVQESTREAIKIRILTYHNTFHKRLKRLGMQRHVQTCSYPNFEKERT